MLIDRPINEYMSLLASDAPAPGGGSAAALAGAVGAALVSMVGRLTEGRDKYAEYAQFNAGLLESSRRMLDDFLAIVDEDVEVFNEMSAAYKMPNETADERAARKGAIQSALKACAATPCKMMELCVRALELTEQAVGRTNRNVASDLGVAALCLKAALQGAWLNVSINLSNIKDAAYAAEYRARGEASLAKGLPLADGVFAKVLL